MFDNVIKFLKKFVKNKEADSKDTAKERLHLVLMQDRANVSADFLELMKQEIIDVIKKYIDVDENSIDVKLTNKTNGDGTTGAPILYANIPIVSIKDENKNKVMNEDKKDDKKEELKKQEQNSEEDKMKQEKNTEEIKEETSKKEDDKKVQEKPEKVTQKEEKIESDKQEDKKAVENQEIENVSEEKTNNPKAEEEQE